MTYYSLNHNAPEVTFEEAVVRGLAPDKGLYFPKTIQQLPNSFFQNIENLSHVDIAYEAIKQFVGDEIPEEDLKSILKTLAFQSSLPEQRMSLVLGSNYIELYLEQFSGF